MRGKGLFSLSRSGYSFHLYYLVFRVTVISLSFRLSPVFIFGRSCRIDESSFINVLSYFVTSFSLSDYVRILVGWVAFPDVIKRKIELIYDISLLS